MERDTELMVEVEVGFAASILVVKSVTVAVAVEEQRWIKWMQRNSVLVEFLVEIKVLDEHRLHPFSDTQSHAASRTRWLRASGSG